MHCSQHTDQSITWVCLERECEQRIMCSRCAVKFHPKHHKLEELVTVIEAGIMNSYLKNPVNNTYGVHRLSTQIESTVKQDQPINIQQIVNNVEENLTRVSSAIQKMKNQVIEATQSTYKEEESQRVQVNNKIKDLESRLAEGDYSDESQLTGIIEQTFQSINQYAQEKESDLQDQHNSNLAVYQKKLIILSNMQQSFSSMITSYFENQFTQDFQQLFEMQLQTLSFDKNENRMEQENELKSLYNDQKSGNISDSNGFLDFVQKKWKQDYENIEYTVSKFTQKLSAGLNYVIKMPIQCDQVSTPNNYQSPNKQQHVQNIVSFQTPLYYHQPQQVMMPQYMPVQQQQYFVSPKPSRDENFAHQFQNDHMAKSQIVYAFEEPTQVQQVNKKIEVQPVCQRALQLRDNEVTQKTLKLKEDNQLSRVENPHQKVTQTLSTCINKISSVTNKSLQK